jgi:hypothetical protein
MQIKKILVTLLFLGHGALHSLVNFGSRDAGIVVDDGILNLGSAALSEGTIVVNPEEGVSSSGMSCTNMKFQFADDTTLKLSGAVSFGETSALTLGTGEKLTVAGSTVVETVSVFADVSLPAVIEGFGSFENSILVSSPCMLSMRWSGSLNADIDLQSGGDLSVLVLESDLFFAPHYTVRSSFGLHAAVNCNGYCLHMGGDAVEPTVLHSMDWINGKIALAGPVLLDFATYTFRTEGAFLNGNGHRFMFNNDSQLYAYGVPVSLTNIILTGVGGQSLAAEAEYIDEEVFNSGSFVCRDVRLESDSEGAGLRALSITGEIVSAVVDIFDGEAAFRSATLELHTDVVIGNEWGFLSDSTINGNQCAITLNAGGLFVDNGVTLTLRNVVLKDVGTYSIYGEGVIVLSGVTIILDEIGEGVDWSTAPALHVIGPVTVVTGAQTLTVNEFSTLENTTLFYDTLGLTDLETVVGFGGSGRVVSLDKPEPDDEEFTPQELNFTGDASLDATEYLYPERIGMTSRVMSFAKAAEGEGAPGGVLLFDGKGRSVVCPYTQSSIMGEGESEAVFLVGDGEYATKVVLTNVTIQGFKLALVDYASEGDRFYFGNNTVLTLQEDWVDDLALTSTLTFGSNSEATYEKIVIDLQGHTIDLGAEGALFLRSLEGSELHIINGRIKNLSSFNIYSSGDNFIVFKDMVLELSNTFIMSSASVRFEGHCVVTGLPESVFVFENDVKTLTIASGARLTFTDQMVYLHNNIGSNNFIFEDSTAQLELIGAHLGHTDALQPLYLKKGMIIVDHTVFIGAGSSGGIWLGDGLNFDNNCVVEIRPGATITIESGVLVQADAPFLG